MNTGTQIVLVSGTLLLVGLGMYFALRKKDENPVNETQNQTNNENEEPKLGEYVTGSSLLDELLNFGEGIKKPPILYAQEKSNLVDPQGNVIPCTEAALILGISAKEIRRKAQEEGTGWIGNLDLLTREKVVDCLNISAQIIGG